MTLACPAIALAMAGAERARVPPKAFPPKAPARPWSGEGKNQPRAKMKAQVLPSMRKIIVVLLVILLTAAPFSLTTSPHRVLVRPNSAQAFSLGLSITFDPSNLAEMLVEFAAKAAIDIFKQKVLKKINKKIIDFARNDGNPRFITDWGLDLQYFSDIAFDSFLTDVTASNLPSNIKGPVLQALNFQRFGGQRIPFSARNLDTISGLPGVGGNVQNFLNDFDSGGFRAFTHMALPVGGGNPFWSLLLATDEAELKSISAANLRQEETRAADGFKPTQRCEGADVDESAPGWETDCVQEGGVPTTTEPGKDTQEKVVSTGDSDQKYIVNIDSSITGILTYVLSAVTSKIIDAQEDGLLKNITFAPTPSGAGALDCNNYSGAQQVACLTATGDPNDFQQARTLTQNAVQKAITDSQQFVSILQQLYECELNLCTQSSLDPSTCSGSTFVQGPLNDINQTNIFISGLQQDLITAQTTNSGQTLATIAAVAFNLNINTQITNAQQRLADCQARTSGAPTLDFSANKTSVESGQSATLSWSTTNVAPDGKCDAGLGWNGQKSNSSGNETVTPGADTTYRLICTNSKGTSIVRDVIIGVQPPPPAPPPSPASAPNITFSAISPSTFASSSPPASISLSWSVSNATNCTGSWSPGNPLPLVGSTSLPPPPAIPASYPYTLNCDNSGTPTSQTQNVVVY